MEERMGPHRRLPNPTGPKEAGCKSRAKVVHVMVVGVSGRVMGEVVYDNKY